MTSTEMHSNTRSATVENKEMPNSGTNASNLNSSSVLSARYSAGRGVDSCMEEQPGLNVTRSTEVEHEGVNIEDKHRACRLIIRSTMHLERATVFQYSDDGCERMGRFAMLFTKKGPCSTRLNVATEHDVNRRTGILIPLIPVEQGTPRPRQRFGRYTGTKIKRGFTKFGRSIRRVVAPSTETLNTAE